MSEPIDKLLSRLDAVRQRGVGKWFARCPAHDDGRPSLSIAITDDGTVLLRCFAGCGAGDVCAAVGLSLSDLFVQRLPDHQGGRGRRRGLVLTARDVVDVYEHESLVVAAIATEIAAGRPVSPEDLERVMVARDRIVRIAEVVR